MALRKCRCPFWSLTLCNAEHFVHPNDLKRYSLGATNKNLKRNADGSLTLYVGTKSPGAMKESTPPSSPGVARRVAVVQACYHKWRPHRAR